MPQLTRWALPAACMLLLTLLTVQLRAPAADVTVFQNEDVAGITYNADLLERGKLPMVDSLEPKAPGPFFLTWAVWKVAGRSVKTLERFAIFWSALAALGVFVAGRIMFGNAAGLLAGLLYTLGSPALDSITTNYNVWMLCTYVWSTALFVAGLKRGHWGWLVAAGVVTVWAALFKRQGGALMPLYMIVLALGPLLQRPAGWARLDRKRSLMAFVGGMLAGFFPVALFYLISGGPGALSTLVHHFFFSETGWGYVGGEVDWSGKLDRLEDGILGFAEFLALPTLLAAFTLVAIPANPRRGWTQLGVLLVGNLLFSFIGVALGFRFYKGYYLQMLPAACWLAAHPDGPLLRWARPSVWPAGLWPKLGRVGWILIVATFCVPAAMSDYAALKKERKRRPAVPHRETIAQRIGSTIRANTKPDDCIWVWGRWAWPVYHFSERLACTRYYKVLGVITTNLDNTWKRPTSMTRFDGRGPWRELGRQLADRKPPFIVTANNEDYRGFKPFEQLLANQYEQVPRFAAHPFRFYVRKGHKLKPPYDKRPPRPAAGGLRRVTPTSRPVRGGPAARTTRTAKPPAKPPAKSPAKSPAPRAPSSRRGLRTVRLPARTVAPARTRPPGAREMDGKAKAR